MTECKDTWENLSEPFVGLKWIGVVFLDTGLMPPSNLASVLSIRFLTGRS